MSRVVKNGEVSADFSVLMAVYIKDDALLFNKALDSIFLNYLLPKSVVIVADGPLTKELEDVISLYSGYKELCVIRCPINLGLANALNVGLGVIRTEFTIRADSDDFNYPERFSLLFTKLQSGYDIVGSSILEVDKAGNELAIRRLPLIQNDIYSFVCKRNPFNHMAVGFRTDLVVAVGGYPKIYLKEDYALWATLIAKKARVCNIDDVLVNATTGEDMYRRRGGYKYAMAEIDMQTHLVHLELKSPLAAIFDGIVRSIIFLAPNRMREFVYLNFLREKVENFQR